MSYPTNVEELLFLTCQVIRLISKSYWKMTRYDDLKTRMGMR